MWKSIALMLLCAVQPVIAKTWTYDFSGALTDHFESLDSTPSLSSAVQTGGQLVYQTLGAAPPETYTTLLFKDVSLSSSQAWTAHLDVETPLSLNQQIPFNVHAWAATSLFAGVQDSGGKLTKLVQIDLEANAPRGNSFYAGAFDLQAGTDLGSVNSATSDGTATLILAFDADAKTIAASSPTGQLFTVDTAGWNLGPNEHFRFAVGFDTQGMTVPQDQVLRLDNLSIATVPEPERYVLLLAGLCIVSAAARRRLARTTVLLN